MRPKETGRRRSEYGEWAPPRPQLAPKIPRERGGLVIGTRTETRDYASRKREVETEVRDPLQKPVDLFWVAHGPEDLHQFQPWKKKIAERLAENPDGLVAVVTENTAGNASVSAHQQALVLEGFLPSDAYVQAHYAHQFPDGLAPEKEAEVCQKIREGLATSRPGGNEFIRLFDEIILENPQNAQRIVWFDEGYTDEEKKTFELDRIQRNGQSAYEPIETEYRDLVEMKRRQIEIFAKQQGLRNQKLQELSTKAAHHPDVTAVVGSGGVNHAGVGQNMAEAGYRVSNTFTEQEVGSEYFYEPLASLLVKQIDDPDLTLSNEEIILAVKAQYEVPHDFTGISSRQGRTEKKHAWVEAHRTDQSADDKASVAKRLLEERDRITDSANEITQADVDRYTQLYSRFVGFDVQSPTLSHEQPRYPVNNITRKSK